jgi:2-methylcitrate dehydratase PrpD
VGSNHTTLDALRIMQQQRAFGADDVEKVIVRGSQVTMDHVGWKYHPSGLTSAQLNLPYCVATLLLDGDCFVDQFTEALVADPARMQLAGRVEMQHDAEITARGSQFRHMVHAEVQLKDGTRLQATVEAPRGSERSFASETDVVDKFRKLAAHALPAAQIDTLLQAVLELDELDDAGRIVDLMVKG